MDTNNVPIGDLMMGIFNYIKKSPKNLIFQIWEKVVPEDLKLHARLAKFRKGVLYIEVEDSNWLYWYHLNKEKLNLYFRSLIDNGIIKKIEFKVKWQR